MNFWILLVFLTYVNADVENILLTQNNLDKNVKNNSFFSTTESWQTENNFNQEQITNFPTTSIPLIEEASTEESSFEVSSSENTIQNSNLMNIVMQESPEIISKHQPYYPSTNNMINNFPYEYLSPPLSDNLKDFRSQQNNFEKMIPFLPFDKTTENENFYNIQNVDENMQGKIDIRLSDGKDNFVNGNQLKNKETLKVGSQNFIFKPKKEEIIESPFQTPSNIYFVPPPPNAIIIPSEVTTMIHGNPTPVQNLLLKEIQLSNGKKELSFAVINPYSFNFQSWNGVFLNSQRNQFHNTKQQSSLKYNFYPQYSHLMIHSNIPSVQKNFVYQNEFPYQMNQVNSQFTSSFQNTNPWIFNPTLTKNLLIKQQKNSQTIPRENNINFFQVEPR